MLSIKYQNLATDRDLVIEGKAQKQLWVKEIASGIYLMGIKHTIKAQ